MKTDIVVPELGESITMGILVQWLVENGAYVQDSEEIFELETDKATLAVPAPASGFLSIIVPEGEEVLVGQVVGVIVDSKEEALSGRAQQATSGSSSPETAGSGEMEDTENAGAVDTQNLSPAVRKLVEERAVDPTKVSAGGPKGNITKKDVLDYLKSDEGVEKQPVVSVSETTKERVAGTLQHEKAQKSHEQRPDTMSTQPERRQERVPMTTIRRRIAERMVQAQRDAALLSTFNEVDMSKVIELRSTYRENFEKKYGTRLGYMSFFVKAACVALKEFPRVNAMIDGSDIIYNHFMDIGIAVSTPRGLLVPVIRNAERLSFAQIEATIEDLATRAREKKLTLDELTGGTFTITNGGVFGSLLSTPIPSPPQTAILGMHAITKRGVVVGGKLIVRPMMYLAMTYDHRMIDGREAVTFLRRIKECVEAPERLLLDV